MVRPFRHFSFLISYASGIFKRNQRVVRPLGELCIPKNKRMTHIMISPCQGRHGKYLKKITAVNSMLVF